jgi:hypothetical protein
MRNVTLWVLAALLMASCNSSNQKGADQQQTADVEKVVTATVEELLAQPAEYEGKQVAVSGMVTHVCRHGGQKCFVLGTDGTSQIRVVPGGTIDEFTIDIEGSTIAFKGIFKVLDSDQATELTEEMGTMADHQTEMAHSEAEKAEYFIEAVDFKEVTP